MADERKTVMIVDDDRLVIEMLRDTLKDSYEVVTASDGGQACTMLDEHQIDVLICDQIMPKKSGVEVLQACAEQQPRTVRILMTASEKVADISDAINVARIHRFIVKPFRPIEVQGLVRGALHEVELEQENARLVEELRSRERELEEELKIRTEELKDVMQQMLNR